MSWRVCGRWTWWTRGARRRWTMVKRRRAPPSCPSSGSQRRTPGSKQRARARLCSCPERHAAGLPRGADS
eukprot:585027-Rhodomonas_salina.1